MLNVIVLAAGFSQRMGAANKMLLPFRGATILESTLSQLVQIPNSKIFVVLGHEGQSVKSVISYSFPSLTYVQNDNFSEGQVSSVKVGLKALQKESPFMVTLGDMPLITTPDYKSLLEEFYKRNKNSPCMLRPRSFGGQIGNPVLFDSSFKEILLNNKDKDSSKRVLQEHKESVHFFKTEKSSFFIDIDNNEDYQKLLDQEKLISSGS